MSTRNRRTRPFQFGTELSSIGIGGWPLGGGSQHVRRGPEDTARVQTVLRALAAGLNWIDVAPLYGLGQAERLVARAIRGIEERPRIFTKCGFVWDHRGRLEQTLRATSVKREVERSLARLELDVLDLVQIHWPIPEEELEEGWHALAQLKSAGKVRHVGVCNVTVPQLERLEAIAPVETTQISYSLIDRHAAERVLPYCHEREITVLAHSPLATGMLAGGLRPETIRNLPEHDHRRKLRHFQERELNQNIEVVRRLFATSVQAGIPVATLALAWALRHEAIDAAIVGLSAPAHVEQAVMALTNAIDADLLDAL